MERNSFSTFLPHVFPRAMEISRLPSQVKSEFLLQHITTDINTASLKIQAIYLCPSDITGRVFIDVRREARLRFQNTVFYANIFALDSSPDTEIDWAVV